MTNKIISDVPVIASDNGTLFLTKSVHNILDHMTGLISIPESSMVNFYKNIDGRAKYCEARGIAYRHFVYPDKISVLRNIFPIKPIETFSEKYRPYFTKDVVDLIDCLDDGAPQNYFFKTDTHLNFEGKIKTSLAILKNFFDFDESEVSKTFESFRGEKKEMLGDLGSKMEPPVKEDRFDIKASFLKRYSNQVGANDGLVVVCLNKEKLKQAGSKRLLIFGDSFCERTLPFLSYFYSVVLFCRSRYFHAEIVDAFRPDHVITESAERYFSSVRLDDMAPRFDLIYGLSGATYSNNADFYKAYNAMLNFGRPPYGKFIHDFLKSVAGR